MLNLRLFSAAMLNRSLFVLLFMITAGIKSKSEIEIPHKRQSKSKVKVLFDDIS